MVICEHCGCFLDKGVECYECYLDTLITYLSPRNAEILPRMDEIETKCDELEKLIDGLPQNSKNFGLIANMKLGLEDIRSAAEEYKDSV